MTIETKISPLIENMFPSFYKEEGPNFIAFVKAYYEWLEENSQLLSLENTTNFNVGDLVTQGTVTGTVISYVDSDVLVLVNGLESFKCVTMCSDLTPITSSSGGSSFIKRGGLSKRMGSLYLARNLLNIRDIDTTMDVFLTSFKEKYLSNIEFDVATNKKLLIKNSFDLYRSKGTSRSIDLFLRLIYGVNSKVYYPGDDLFKLSEGEWFTPQYLEISTTGYSSSRAINLIGKIITGVTSGAQAFVEKYIKHETPNGFTHVLYVTNVSGVFNRGELIKSDKVYPDSPTILGSLGNLTDLKTKSGGFNIGDIVDVTSINGINGKAKVTSINESTGAVTFNILNSGWGYSVNTGNTDPTFLQDHSQTIVSDNILFLTNVAFGNSISKVSVLTPGLTYNNTNVITIKSQYTNAIARPITNSTGGVTSIVLISPGTGFFGGSPSISVANSTGGSTAGSGLSATFTYEIPKKQFTYLEDIVQKQALVTFDTGTITPQWTNGADILVSNGTSTIGYGTILSYNSNMSTTGITKILLSNNFMVTANNKLVLASNTQVTANVQSYTDVSATGKLVNLPSAGYLSIDPTSYINLSMGDQLYQLDQTGETIASATISNSIATRGFIPIDGITGTFIIGSNLYSTSISLNTKLKDFQTELGLYQVNNTFVTTETVPSAKIIIPFTGVNASLTGVAGGKNAKYNVGNISDFELTTLNTDIISNSTMYSKRLNATQYSLPAQATANLSSIIFNSLKYKDFILGSIYDLGFTDTGYDYTHAPYLLPYQPYTSGYNHRDRILTLTDINGSFLPGEYVQQSIPDTRSVLNVANPTPFIVGERVYTANNTASYIANATIISIVSNAITVNNIQGTLRDVDNLKKFANTIPSIDITSVVSNNAVIIAKGILKSLSANTMYVKRIQFNNYFSNTVGITGLISGATANVSSINLDYSTNRIGWNADIQADVFTANGVITGLSVTDSGFGFINGQAATFTLDGKSGTATVINNGIGIGSGRYKNHKGFVSDLSKIHDGNYYQEYSYDVISRIPLEKYSDMFKKVMHTAGTKFFGSVLIDTVTNTGTKVVFANSSINYDNLYNIQDRILEEIEDRSNITITIRQ